MTDRDKALEIAKNLNKTIQNYTGSNVLGSGSIRNTIFTGTKPSKNVLQQQLDKICKRHGINIEDINE
jgi:hypothetical protein